MREIFLAVFEMSMTASMVIGVVLLIRLLLRRAPKRYAYLLWSVVAFRLACPVSFQAFFSLFSLRPIARFSDALTMSPNVTAPTVSAPVSTIPGTPMVTAPVTGGGAVVIPPSIGADAGPAFTLWPNAAMWLWCVGIVVMLGWAIFSYLRLMRRLRTAVRLEPGVWASDAVRSPFILGFIRPRIYLPFGLEDESYRCVLLHERCHLRHLDHLVKLLAFGLLILHWFNPLVWLSFVLMSRDMEMRCDECVLQENGDVRCTYGHLLVSFAANRRFPAPSPLAFGEVGVGARIKNLLNWKKPAVWITVGAILLCVVVLLVCAANPPVRDWLALDDDPFESATTNYHSFDGSPLVFALKDAELAKLAERISALALREDDRRANDSCAYSVTVVRESGETMLIRGFDEAVEFVWREAHYLTEDAEFAAYLRSLCGGEVRAAAGENAQIVYRVSDIVYESYQFSFSLTLESAPLYCRDAAGHLWEETGGDWIDLGVLTPITLTRENFDDAVRFPLREESMDAAKMREACLEARGTTYMTEDGTARVYNLLRLDDGCDYLAYGYRLESGEVSCRWIFRLRESLQGSYSAVSCAYMSPLSSSLAIGGDGQRLIFTEQTVAFYTGDNIRRFAVGLPLAWAPFNAEGWEDRFGVKIGIPPVSAGNFWYEAELTDGYSLINRRDGRFWLVKENQDIWSIYVFEPTTIGEVVWQYKPMSNALPNTFRFTIEESFIEAIVWSTAGTLEDEATGKRTDVPGGCLVLKDGNTFGWHPRRDDNILLNWCEVNFQLTVAPDTYRSGRIRINRVEHEALGTYLYYADLVSDDFVLAQDPEYGGGLILPSGSAAADAADGVNLPEIKLAFADPMPVSAVVRYAADSVRAEMMHWAELGQNPPVQTLSPFRVTDVEITRLEEVPTAAVGIADRVALFRLDWRFRADEPANVMLNTGVQLRDGWIETLPGINYIVFHEDFSRGVWTPVGTLTQQEIDTVYSTEKMLQNYGGDPYVAAVMELWAARQGQHDVNADDAAGQAAVLEEMLRHLQEAKQHCEMQLQQLLADQQELQARILELKQTEGVEHAQLLDEQMRVLAQIDELEQHWHDADAQISVLREKVGKLHAK